MRSPSARDNSPGLSAPRRVLPASERPRVLLFLGTFLGFHSHRGRVLILNRHRRPQMSLHRALIKWVSGPQRTLLPRRCPREGRERCARGAPQPGDGPAWRGPSGGRVLPAAGCPPPLRPHPTPVSRGPPRPAPARRRAQTPPRRPAPSRPRPRPLALRPLPAGSRRSRRSERGPGDTGSRRGGRSMGRFRGGLRCIKYLLLGFNLLFWVSPRAGRAGQGRGRAGARGRGPRGAGLCGVRARPHKAGCSNKRRCGRGRQRGRGGIRGRGEGVEAQREGEMERQETVRRGDTLWLSPLRNLCSCW